MANATVEKMKALGLRHGEKVFVGLAALICVLCLAMAAGKETIDLTPDQVKRAADQASSNINREQKPEDILQKLEGEFLKQPDFEATVEKQAKTRLAANDFRLRQPFVSFEPGGGLLRDTPTLIAVSELYAYPGRGGILMYALDADGNRLPPDPVPVDEATVTRRKKKRRGNSMMSSSGSSSSRSMMMGGQPQGKPKSEAELKKEYEEKKAKVQAALAGKGAPKEAEKDEAAAGAAEQQEFKEITKGVRWVVLTGTIDHQKLRDNYLAALKQSAVAHPHYKRLDVERQTKNADGTWSDWEPVDMDENLKILDNLPEEEEEWTPEDVRFDALVDPLPFLKAGSWEHVHIASLVPKEKTEVPKPEVGTEGTASSSMMSYMQQMRRPGVPSPDSSSSSASSAMMRSSMMMRGGMSSSEGMMGGGAETINFKTTEAETIMIRSLDFTVKSDTTYRYHVRIVVFNPNKDREDVNPGVDTKSTLLFGPWSEPTEEVTMPADVTAYALAPSATSTKGDQVRFEITRWDPTDGVTVVKDFDAGPGEVVGEADSSTRIPSAEGKGEQRRRVDFVSHQLVLDVAGGLKSLPPKLGISGNKFESPALTLMLRPDGAVVVRNSAKDARDEVRRDIKANYTKELEESGKKRESSYGPSSMQQMMMRGSRPGSGRGR